MNTCFYQDICSKKCRSKENEVLDSKTKTYSDGPFSQTFETADKQFDQLLGGQEKEDAWTDQEGFMVEATALYLDCQIYILQTGIEGPVTSEGLSGPLQIINKSHYDDDLYITFNK